MPAQPGRAQPGQAQPGQAQPGRTKSGDGRSRRSRRRAAADRRPDRPPHRPADRPAGRGGRLSRIWEGSLSGGLSVCVIAGSGVIGTVATVATRAEPGSVLGLAVLAGTVAAALTVQPQTGRLIFPVPALSYVLGALASGAAYDHSANKTELAVGAAQWIANGFFVMVLSTLLAIALTTVRWFMWRREQRAAGPPVPGVPATGMPAPGRPAQQWPPRPSGWDQQRGSGPYNFSSGA